MLARFNAALIAVAFVVPALVSGSPLVARTDHACNTGTLHCCETTMATSDPSASTLAGLLGIVANLGATIGLKCSTLNVIGLGGGGCSQQTVCCTGNNFNGLIAVGCTPFNLHL